MKIETMEKAILEAKRFIEKASILKLAADSRKNNNFYGNPKEQGAVNRASMDLTRVLADLRQGR